MRVDVAFVGREYALSMILPSRLGPGAIPDGVPVDGRGTRSMSGRKNSTAWNTLLSFGLSGD